MTQQPPERRGSRRLAALMRPRTRRVDIAIAVLLAVLGFALVVQVRSTQSDALLVSSRPEDLVQILDELSNRSARLRQEVSTLNDTRQRLTSGSGADEAALAEARKRTALLSILAGTARASGPGVTVTISDPRTQVSASLLVDALEELRDAGAEAVQLEGTGTTGRTAAVRVVASTYLIDTKGGISADGVPLIAPYRYVVLGDPATLAGAMAIPGGIVDAVRQQGGSATVAQSPSLTVSALRALPAARYARPAGR